MSPSTDTPEVVLEVKNISKHFGKVQALDDVSLAFYSGEIHTLLGENGAGKTTLMNIIYGLYHADRGEIFLNGLKRDIEDPKDSLQFGIGMVPQTFKLILDMTVVENVFLFMKNTKFLVNKSQVKERIIELSKLFSFGLEDKLDFVISDLSEGEKQKVEILKILVRGSKILLFDEATNVLAPNELNVFLEVIKDMNKRGFTILYITHRLKEAMEISDKISVFRKGRLIGTISGTEATFNKLTTMMVGSELEREYSVSPRTKESKILTVSNINVKDENDALTLKNISFDLYEGEIVGLAGIDGNGSDQLAETIIGLRKPESGTIRMRGQDLGGLTPMERMRLGMNYLPGSDSLVPQFNIRKNSILDYPEREPFSKKGILNWFEITNHAKNIIDVYRVQTPGVFLPALKLSGGNKQRLALGRKIEANPALMVAYHPTKGLDISSQNFIYEKFQEMQRAGTTILFIGTDLDELFQICNRIMVIYRGEIVGIFDDTSKVSKIEIGMLMTGGSHYIEKGNNRQ